MGSKNKLLDINPELPTLDLEDFEPDLKKEMGVCNKIKGSTHFGLIGTGQCGARIAKAFYDIGYRKAIALNTSGRELELLNIPEKQKLLIDTAPLSKHQILHLLDRIFGNNVNHIMICFGAAGNCGSTNALSIIETAKQYARYIGLKKPNRKVGVVLTMPTKNEPISILKTERTRKAINKLIWLADSGQISPLIIIDNEKMKKRHKNATVRSFWRNCNSEFAALFDSFNTLSAKNSSYTSFDPADYHSIIESAGCMIMGATEVTKLNDKFTISNAVMNNIRNFFFIDGFDLSTARTAGCIVVAGKKLITRNKSLQADIDYAFDCLADIACNAVLHRGIFEAKINSIKVYTILSGLSATLPKI